MLKFFMGFFIMEKTTKALVFRKTCLVKTPSCKYFVLFAFNLLC